MERIVLSVLLVFALSISAVLCVQVHDLKKVNHEQAEKLRELERQHKSTAASAQANTDTLLRHSADIQGQTARIDQAEERLTKLEETPRQPATTGRSAHVQWDGKQIAGGKAEAITKQDWNKQAWQKEKKDWNDFNNVAGNEEWNARWEEAVNAKRKFHMEQQQNKFRAEQLLENLRDAEGADAEDKEAEAALRERVELQRQEADLQMRELKIRFQDLQKERAELMRHAHQEAREAEVRRKQEHEALRQQAVEKAEPEKAKK